MDKIQLGEFTALYKLNKAGQLAALTRGVGVEVYIQFT